MPPTDMNAFMNNKHANPEPMTIDPVTGLNADKSSNGPAILATNGILTVCAMITVAARFYVRSVMLKTTGRDDWVILAALICGLGTIQCFIGETHYGLGMHQNAITLAELVEQRHWQFFHTLFVTTGITLVKVSISFLLLRIVPDRGYRIFLWILIVFFSVFIVGCGVVFIFWCRPITANWDYTVQAQCLSYDTYKAVGLFNSVVNIVSDILLACLPIPMVWHLQVNKRTKVSLMVVLSLGFVVCVCAIYKTALQIKNFEDPDRTRDATFSTWFSVELFVGIIAASLPSLRPLFKSILETSTNVIRSRSFRFGLSSNSFRRGGNGGSGGSSGSGSNGRGNGPPAYTKEDELAMEKIAKGAGINDFKNYEIEIMTTSVEPGAKHKIGMSSNELDEMYPIQGIRKTVKVSVT